MTARLSDADEQELAALRARAYGPAGDLGAAGEERLRELEDRGIDRPPTVDDAQGSGGATPDAAVAWSPGRDVATPTGADPEPAGSVREGAARRHPLVLLAGAVVLGAVVLGAGYGLGRLPATDDTDSRTGTDAFLPAVAADADRVTTLVSAAPFTSRGLDPDSLVQYQSLGDATFWTASEADGARCLLITVPIDGIELSAYGGVYQASCAPGGLAPSIDWTVTSGYPSPPGLPVGSIVRLTLDGDRLRVETGRAP